MLFGTLELQREVLEQAQKYAEKESMKLIFGAMVGSVSKGLHYADSDYDTRFLYLRNDFPEKICVPCEMQEKELVKRYYPKNKVYEWIPFWEATSFLQFLINPSFKDDFSVGLYNIVGWTFLSPYIWDPYGLQSKLMPLVNKIFCREYEISYHKKILDKYITEFGKDMVITKSYLYSVHAAATVEWSMKFNEQPPIHLQTLLYGLNRRKVWSAVKEILDNAREIARENYANSSIKLHGSHFEVKSVYNKVIEEYVDGIISDSEWYHLDGVIDVGGAKVVNDMYGIIYESVFRNEEIALNSMRGGVKQAYNIILFRKNAFHAHKILIDFIMMFYLKIMLIKLEEYLYG